MFEIENYKNRIYKKIKQNKTIPPYLYLYLEDDKSLGYISFGGIMMQINEHTEERITEKEKLWFD